MRYLLREVGGDVRVFRLILQAIGAGLALFLWFIALLQFKDGYTGYAITSVVIGSLSAFLVFRSFRMRANF